MTLTSGDDLAVPPGPGVRPRHRCSAFARAQHVDPIGWAGHKDGYLFVEAAPPWGTDPLARIPHLAPVAAVARELRDRGDVLGVHAIAPDGEYTRSAHTRVLYFTRPTPPFALFDRHEYLVPDDAAVDLCTALLRRRDPAGFADRRIDGSRRDVFVCTDGRKDVCCGAFGFPLYRALRQRRPAARIWRASHIGGDRFAPTALTMPDARSWAHLDPDVAVAIADHTGPVEAVLDHYRGWAGLTDSYAQTAEREAFARHGWAWSGYRTTARVLDDGPGPRDVLIEYASPDCSDTGAYRAQVEIARYVPGLSCGHSPEAGTLDFPEFRVTRFEVVAPATAADHARG